MEAFYYWISFLIMPVFSWNVDTRTPIIFSGSKGSYFGYSVALHDNSKGSFALVSASRANSTFRSRRSLHQPGVVYKCDITTAQCKEVIFEKTANAKSSVDSPQPYEAKEDDMWLGVSLDVQSAGRGYILACGHLWRNQRFLNHYFPNGACYIIDREFRSRSYKALMPLIDEEKQVVVDLPYYSDATAGMAATFVEFQNESGTDILIGAPGAYDWTGTVISYFIRGDRRRDAVPVIADQLAGEQHDADAYVGYSVTTGRCFAPGRLQYIAGAPRDGDNKGRVYVFESLRRDRTSLTVLQQLEGEQLGAYFGACVVGVNVNRDTFTDLLVGSPFYSLPGLGDEGKVYVYISNGLSLVKHRVLMGLKKPRSRFGTTIASVGDVNQDGFADVAVGAPYEDGCGAIYIYHGSSEGLDEKYKQRIGATDFRPTLSGFGISISKGKDIDGNKYPDILVGSYASDDAILFRTRPLVKVFGNITFDPSQLDANISRCTWNYDSIPCFEISLCLSYSGEHLPEQLEISTELSSARLRNGLRKRKYLVADSKLTSYVRQQIRIKREESHCYHHQAYVVSESEDFINPIQMTLNFNLTHDVNKEETFCKSCPVLHPDLPSTITETITFLTGCGEDIICTSDLNLTVNVFGLSSDELVVGQDKVIVLSVELQNFKEPAYNTDIYIYIPPDVQIIYQDDCENKVDFSDLPTIVCNGGNPLISGQVVKYEIKLDTSGISAELDYLTIILNTTTASQELNPEDNGLVVMIPLKILTDITILGNPMAEEITLDKTSPDESVDVVHLYTVLKYLPGPINSISLEFRIPTTIDKDVSFLQLNDVKINDGSSHASVPASCDFRTTRRSPSAYNLSTTMKPGHMIPTGMLLRLKRSANNGTETSSASVSPGQSDHPSSYILDCNTSSCMRISCTAGPFKDSKLVASFRIYTSVNITDLMKILKKWDKITIVTEGKVKVRNQRKNSQQAGHRPDETKVFTTIQQHAMPPVQKVEIWIIIVGVVAGILLLMIISLVLAKVGFFKRKDYIKEMMTRELIQPDSSTASDTSNNDSVKEDGL